MTLIEKNKTLNYNRLGHLNNSLIIAGFMQSGDIKDYHYYYLFDNHMR